MKKLEQNQKSSPRLPAEAEKEVLSYCRQALYESQQAAWAMGNRRVRMRDLMQTRSGQGWHEFGTSRAKQEPLDDEYEESLNWDDNFSKAELEALKKIPDLKLLQASAGLPGGGVAGRRTRRDPKPIKRLIERMAKVYGWQQFLAEGALRVNWEKIVGPAVAQHAKIEKIQDGTVVVRCDTTRWATELRLLIPQMMAAIERNSGELVLKQLVILGPNQPSWSHGKYSVRGRGVRDTYA